VGEEVVCSTLQALGRVGRGETEVLMIYDHSRITNESRRDASRVGRPLLSVEPLSPPERYMIETILADLLKP